MNHERKIELLCRMISPCTNRVSLSNAVEDASKDWLGIIKISNENLLTPALYYSLFSSRLFENINDEKLQSFLSIVYQKNLERNENIYRQILDIQKTLSKDKISPLFLKGATVLIEKLYPDVGIRVMGDLDLMILEEYIGSAIKKLQENGYIFFGRKFNRWHHHYPRMNKEGYYAAVEPHFRVIYDKNIEYIPFNRETSATPLNKDFSNSKVLKPTWHLYHTFLHTAVVDKNHRQWRLGLRHLYDFVMLAVSYGDKVDWQELYALARKYEHEKILEDYLYMAYKLFNLETPLGFNRARGWLHLKKVMWQMGLVPGTKVHNLYRAYTEFGEIYSYESLKNFYGLHSKSQYPAAFVRYIFYHMRKHLL